MKFTSNRLAAVLVLLAFFACRKSLPQTQSAIPSTPEETAKLLIGHWIEDSLTIQDVISIPFDPPSYLNIDSNLNYRLVQTSMLATPGNGYDETDTGQFTDIGARYITPTSLYNNQNFLGSFGRMQIDTLTAHRMVLYGYTDLVPPNFYFHK